jgi:L-malate glycosyltransferase
MTAVHQFIHSFVDRDAASSHARHVQRIVRDMGLQSDVYAWEWRGERSKAKSFTDYRTAGDPNNTWMLYHLATESPIATFLHDRPERVAVNHHNITTPELIEPWEPTIAAELLRARSQFHDLAAHTERAIGVSKFNAEELLHAGYRNVDVAPVLFDPGDFEHAVDAKLDEQLKRAKHNGGSDWLFVGRVAPHKCLHDVVKALSVYRRVYDPNARLHLVGGMWSHRYWTVLNHYIDNIGLRDAVFVTNGVSNAALGAYYRNADVFVYLSEHEGFGVPVLEAFHNDVPVVAFNSTAIPETVGDGGIVLDDKASGRVAAAVHKVLSDGATRRALRQAGHRRLEEFTLAKSEARWREVIEKMVSV